MRTVCVLTGTRAEYGLLKPITYAIQEHPQLELSLMVASMHLSKEFGETKRSGRSDDPGHQPGSKCRCPG